MSLSERAGSHSLNPKLKQSIEDCAQDIYKVSAKGDGFVPTITGVPGTFLGSRIDKNGLEQEVFVVNENRSYDGYQLAVRAHVMAEWIAGVTFNDTKYVLFADGTVGRTPSGYSPYRNFTAKDLHTNPNVKEKVSWVHVQVWELGNSLGYITETNRGGTSLNPNPTQEGGKLFSDCVRKKYGRAF